MFYYLEKLYQTVFENNHLNRYIRIRKEAIREMDQPLTCDDKERSFDKEKDHGVIEVETSVQNDCENDIC